MALVICVGADDILMASRRSILEQAGHAVVSVSGEPELVTACQGQKFEVAIIGQGLHQNEKRRTLELIRWHCPKVRVLELFEAGTASALATADDWLGVPANPPSELAQRVESLANKRAKSRRIP